MPTYEYRCQFCHELTEAFQRMSDNALVTCPHCGKAGLTRIVSGGAGVLYKGEGWYVTDYSKKSSGGKDAPPATSSKPGTTEGSAENKDKQPSEKPVEQSSEPKTPDAPASTPKPAAAAAKENGN